MRYIKQAAVMLIVKNGLILAVSRRHNPNMFGLPGGKKENNETIKNAAIRECREETGIIVKDCIQFFERTEPPITPDGLSFYTYCFYALDWEGTPKNSEEGVVEWMFASELTTTLDEGGKGAFADYNKRTLEAFSKIYPDVIVFSTKNLTK